MLFDVPIHHGYRILTKPSDLKYEKNGLRQVGNETLPEHEIAPQAVKKSSIYDKNLSGLSEAGYGRRYPYYHLSEYRGAGSPRSSLSTYRGAGSPRSSLTAYGGAGSPRSSVIAPKLAVYGGAGSPKTSLLADAYINDNPFPGTLHSLSGLSRSGIPGRPSSRGPGLSGILDTLTSSFGKVFSTAAQVATESGTKAVTQAITKSVEPKPQPIIQTTSPVLPAMSQDTFLGMSAVTASIVVGLGAFLLLRKN